LWTRTAWRKASPPLRRALDEKPGDNSYIVTLPGRGYQFVAPVQVVSPENLSVVPDVATADSHGSSGLLFQEHTIRTSVITEEKEQLSLPTPRNRALVRLVAGFSRSRNIGCGILRMDAIPPGSAADESICHQVRLGHPSQPADRSQFSAFAICLAVPKKAGCPRPCRKC